MQNDIVVNSWKPKRMSSCENGLGMAKTEAEGTGQEARKMSDAFKILQEQKRKSEEWKQIQHRLMAGVDGTAKENGRLQQEVGQLTAEFAKLREDKESAIRCSQQFQDELGPLKMELQVSQKDIR
jgi:archaellum component FlaC